jgi:hypothetical protein
MFHIFGVGIAYEHPAVNGPGRWNISPVEQMPSIQGFSIEKQGPAFFFFVVGKYIFLFGVSGTSEYEKQIKSCYHGSGDMRVIFHIQAVI